jgi:hypothetical protein
VVAVEAVVAAVVVKELVGDLVVAIKVAAVGEAVAVVAVVVTGTMVVIKVDTVEVIKVVGEVMDHGRIRIKVKVRRQTDCFYYILI